MGRTTARARFFRYGELPLVILALLADAPAPMRGFDVMAELDRLFSPDYRASAGSVYPALTALEAERLIRRAARDGQRYELTASGRSALEARRRTLATIETRTGVRLGGEDDLAAALERFSSRVLPLAGRVDPARVERILDDAAHQIGLLLPTSGRGRRDDCPR